MNPNQLYTEVIVPALKRVDLYSPAAARLLLGTAMTESGLCWLRQHNQGPARGIYQIEPRTHEDIWENYLAYRDGLAQRVRDLTTSEDTTHQLISNLSYATVMARLVYLRVPHALPNADDIEGLAHYWKDHYNTYLGAGRPEHFMDKAALTLAEMEIEDV